MNRIKDKISEIEKYLEELDSILPCNLEEYKTDFKIKAACERYCEKIIEAVVDLAFLIIKDKNLRTPEDDKQTFEILREEELISEELAEKLKDAKSMRNFIIHKYGEINDEIVFESITKELVSNVKEFIERLK